MPIVRATRGAYYVFDETNKKIDIPGIVYVRFNVFRTAQFSESGLVPVPGFARVSGQLGLTELQSSLDLFDLTRWIGFEIPGIPALPSYDLFVRFTEGSTARVIQFVNVMTGSSDISGSGLSTIESLVDDGLIQVQTIPFQLRLDGAIGIGDNVRIFDDPDI